jgi:hypothetical protein
MNSLSKLTMYDLALSTRVFEVFKIHKITIEDILANKYSLSYFWRLPNIGRKSLKEIKEAFLSYGFKFSDNDKHFREVDHFFEANEQFKANQKNEQNEQKELYLNLNLEVIDKCREALISSFNSIVKKESFSHNEFSNAMNEHKKILNMFEQNVRNVL